MEANRTIKYYGTYKVCKDKLLDLIEAAVASLEKYNFDEEASSVNFVTAVFEIPEVAKLLIYLSRLPVFETEYALSLQHDLDLLALTKKLKFFTNLPICQVLLLIQQLMERSNGTNVAQYKVKLLKLISEDKYLSNLKLKDFVKKHESTMKNADLYIENNEALETIDPHAVYPTSIYRHSNGLTLATPDSQTIEALMTTSLTTTIKITRGVLEPTNNILSNVYKPLGRCVAVVDDKVIIHYGEKLKQYFDHHGIDLVTLIHGGNEVDIADPGGFATALYHR